MTAVDRPVVSLTKVPPSPPAPPPPEPPPAPPPAPPAAAPVRAGLPDVDPPPWRYRWVLYAAGVGIAAVGVKQFMKDPHQWLMPIEWLRWLVTGALVHDLIFAPVAAVVGVVLLRLLPGRYRGPVQGGLFVSAMLLLATAPQVFGKKTSTNVTLQPRDYTSGLLIVLGAVWAVVVVLLVVRRAARTGGPRPES